jgi:hypothetical protein
MKLRSRLKARSQRKARERHLAERERQKELSSQDTERRIRDVAEGAAGAGQGGVLGA